MSKSKSVAATRSGGGAWRTDRLRVRSDQGGALTDRVVTNVVDLAGDETSRHAGVDSRADEVVPNVVLHDGGLPARMFRVEHRYISQRRFTGDPVELDAEPFGRHVADRQVSADRVALDRPGDVTAASRQRDVPADRQSPQKHGVRV